MYRVENWLTHDLRFDVAQRVRGVDKSELDIIYGYGQAWFGRFLAGFSSAGLCWFEPLPGEDSVALMRKCWAPACLRPQQDEMEQRLRSMLGCVDAPQRLHLCGTPWQLRVWEALLCVPRGDVVNYGSLAKMLHNRDAARALGNAVGANHIAMLVPCHRVKPASGGVGGYRWGADLKRYLLDFEARPTPAAA